MNNVNQKQTLSSSSLPTLTSKDEILAYQRSKIPIPNGIPIISSSIPINTNLSSISTLRSSSTTTIISNGSSSNSQSQASILSSGTVSSTGKCLLSSTSLRGDNSLFSNSRLAGSQASLFGSSNGNGTSDYKAKGQVCITTNNGRSNEISHESDSNSSTSTPTSTLTSTSHGLKLTTSGNTTVTFGNGRNHNSTPVWSSCGISDGESVKLSSSSGSSALPEEIKSIRLSSASVSSNSSWHHNSTSNSQGVSTSEFSDEEVDTTTSSSDPQHQCPDICRIPSDADNSIDMFAQTPAAKKIQAMMEGHANQSLNVDDKAESDEDMIGDIIVPATQAVLSSHGSSPLDFSPDAIVIVMASDEEDDSFACSSPLNPAETAMVIPSTDENSEFSFSSKHSPVHKSQNQSLSEGNDIIVPATQQFQPNISDELQEPHTIACSDEDEDSISSKKVDVSQLRNDGTLEPKIPNMNSTFTVSPFPMKISSRGDVAGMIRNQPEKHQFSSNSSNIPKIQLDAIVEVNFDDNRVDRLDLTVSEGAGDCSNLQPMNSTFVMNFPNSQKSSEQLNVTFTAAPPKNNSHEEDNICSHKGDDDNVKCATIETENYNSPNVKNVASSSSLDITATTNVSECLTPISSVPSYVNSSVVAVRGTPSPRRGKKLYDVPQPPPLKTMEPPKNVDSSDSEEESVTANIVGSSTSAAAATSRCSKPRTYSRRGRDTKADREALFETENPRPSTSAALVRHNMRSLKMKPRSSSRTDKSDGRLSVVPVKSNRAPARSRSKNHNTPLKINSKAKPKLRIPKKVKKVLSSSDDDVKEKNTPLQDLPDIDIPLLKSKSSKQGKPKLAEKTENETEEVPLNQKLEVRDESVQPGIGSEELLHKAVDSRTEENVRLNLCAEDGYVATATARSPCSGSTSSKDNLQAKPIPLDSAIKSSPPVLQAARKQPELQEFNPTQEDGPESGSVEDQPPILLREKNPLQRQTRKRGRPTRADKLKATAPTDNFLPLAAAPLNNPKSEYPGENKDQCKPKPCEEIERAEVICVSPPSTFLPAQHLPSSVVEAQRVRVFLSTESEVEAESKVSKHSDNMGSVQSTKHVGEIGTACSSYSDLPPISQKNEKHLKSNENRAATSDRQNIVKSSAISNGKNPEHAMPEKLVTGRPSLCTTGSTPSNISEAEANPSKSRKKEHIQKKAGKRNGKTEYHTEVEDLPLQTRSKRVRKQFEVNDESVILISDEDDHVEVDDKRSKRGRPKKRKAGANHLVEVETLELGRTKKSLNVVAVQSLNPKKPKNDGNPSLGSNRNTASKVKLIQLPEFADVPHSEHRGLRRSGRSRKERDFGDGMVPY